MPITRGARPAVAIATTRARRQLVRRDGALALDALYELQTHDGVVISVRNRVLIRPNKYAQPGRYAFSTLEIVAPDGAYAWLNDYVYVGTLTSLMPAKYAVVIRVYRVLCGSPGSLRRPACA